MTVKTSFVLFLLMTLKLFVLAQDPLAEALAIRDWHGEFTFSVNYADINAIGLNYNYNYTCGGQFDLSKSDEGYRWFTDENSCPQFQFSANEVETMKILVAEEQFEEYKTFYTAGELDENNNSVEFYVNTEGQTYSLHIHVGSYLKHAKVKLPPSLEGLSSDNEEESMAPFIYALLKNSAKEKEEEKDWYSVSIPLKDEPITEGKMVLSGNKEVEINHYLGNGRNLKGRFSWSVQPGKREKGEAPTQLDGCETLKVGQATVFKIDKPSGCKTINYHSDGSSIQVFKEGKNAKVTAIASGESTLFAECEMTSGEKIKLNKKITVVQVSALNQGKPLEIGLYNAKGEKTDAIKTINVAIDPVEKAELLKFNPVNPALISAVSIGGDQVQVQGVANGKTNLQAYTDCKEKVGSPILVSVVNCDKDVIETLKAQRQQLKSRLESNLKQVNELLTSKEFEAAEKNGEKTINDLSNGLVDVAVGMGKPNSALAKGALEFFEFSNNLKSYSESMNQGDYLTGAWQAVNMLGKETNTGKISGAIKTAVELADAAKRMGEYLGTLSGVSERLEELDQQLDQTRKEYLEVGEILFRICKEPEDKPKDDNNPEAEQAEASQNESKPQSNQGQLSNEVTPETVGSNDSDLTTDSQTTNEPETSNPNNPTETGTPQEPQSGSSTGLALPIVDEPDSVKCSCISNVGLFNDLNTQEKQKAISANIKSFQSNLEVYVNQVLSPSKAVAEELLLFYSNVDSIKAKKRQDFTERDFTELLRYFDGQDENDVLNLLNQNQIFYKSNGVCATQIKNDMESIIQSIKWNF